MPSLRARLVRGGLVRALAAERARAGPGVPLDLEDAEALEEYALALRERMEQLARFVRLPRRMTWASLPASAPVPGERVEARHDHEDVTSHPLGGDRAGRVVLHLHGGAYCLCSPRTHRGLAAAISRVSRAPVVVPEYRLAPEHRFPAALDDAVATYRWLVDEQQVPPSRIAVTGDSAGGGLAAALLVRLRDEGSPLPACAALLSPWVDLAATEDGLRGRARRDPWLPARLFVPAALGYAGDTPLDHPHVSPVYADLAGLPPLLVHVGTDELLYDDGVTLVERARAAGVDASVGVFDGLWHVFQAFPGLPESRWALREIGAFIRRHTPAARLAATVGTSAR